MTTEQEIATLREIVKAIAVLLDELTYPHNERMQRVQDLLARFDADEREHKGNNRKEREP